MILVPPLPPGSPPNRAKGFTSCRSLHWLPVIGTSVISRVRRKPRPPRHWPAPPESGISSKFSTREREAGLEHLRRIEAAIAVDGDDAIVAVVAKAPAPAARHQVVAGEIFVVFGVLAAEHEIGAGAAFRRHGALGLAGAHRADHDVGKSRMRLGVAGDQRVRDSRHSSPCPGGDTTRIGRKQPEFFGIEASVTCRSPL